MIGQIIIFWRESPSRSVTPNTRLSPTLTPVAPSLLPTKPTTMRMETAPDSPAPMVTSDMLPEYVNKCVLFAGKVAQAGDDTLHLDGGSGGATITVCRAMPPMVHIDQGMTLIVRGVVTDQRTITENPGLPTTIASDNFGRFHIISRNQLLLLTSHWNSQISNFRTLP